MLGRVIPGTNGRVAEEQTLRRASLVASWQEGLADTCRCESCLDHLIYDYQPNLPNLLATWLQQI